MQSLAILHVLYNNQYISGALQHHPVISTPNHRAETLHNPSSSLPKRAGRPMHRENVNNMPESSREIETEEGRSDRQQRDQGNHSSYNIVSLVSQFADDNLTLVRVGISFV